jgi:hypothetical protein
VKESSDGTGLRFTHIESNADNTAKEGRTVYQNLDSLTWAAQPTVDTVTQGHFIWDQLKTSGTPPTYVNPVTVSSIVEGRDDGHEASAAKIVVDYAGSSALYSYDFTFGDSVAKIHIDKNDGAVTIATKVAAAIDATAGWTASRNGTTVTITHDTAGEVKDWGTKYIADSALGEFSGAGSGTKGVLDLEIESGITTATATNPKAISFFGLPVLVKGSSPADLAEAIANTLNGLPHAQWPAGLDEWKGDVVRVDSGNHLHFTQSRGNETIDPIEAFPDGAIASWTSALPTGLLGIYANLPVTGVVYDENTTLPDEFSFVVGSGNATETLFGPQGGIFDFLGKTIIVDAYANATTVATAIKNAFNNISGPTSTGFHKITVGGTDYYWTAGTSSGNTVTFKLVDGDAVNGSSPNPTPVDVVAADVPGVQSAWTTALGSAFQQISNIGANPTEVQNAVNTKDPTWVVGSEPKSANNGVQATVQFGTDRTANGQDKLGDQIGWINPLRETDGDGDYLDFSAFDVVLVTQGGSYLAGSSNANGNVVDITGGADGVYNFTLTEGGSSTLIGVVDFGAAVDFHNTNFILDNDIIV